MFQSPAKRTYDDFQNDGNIAQNGNTIHADSEEKLSKFEQSFKSNMLTENSSVTSGGFEGRKMAHHRQVLAWHRARRERPLGIN